MNECDLTLCVQPPCIALFPKCHFTYNFEISYNAHNYGMMASFFKQQCFLIWYCIFNICHISRYNVITTSIARLHIIWSQFFYFHIAHGKGMILHPSRKLLARHCRRGTRRRQLQAHAPGSPDVNHTSSSSSSMYSVCYSIFLFIIVNTL